MADSTDIPETPDDEQSSQSQEQTALPRRTRRRAGAPAGAPTAATSEPVAETAAPRTVVPEQSAAPEFLPAAPAKRPRRRAGAPAGAPTVTLPEPAPAQGTPEQPVAEEDAGQDGAQPAAQETTTAGAPAAAEGAADQATEAETTAQGEPADQAPVTGVVDDLRALATSRGAESPTESPDLADAQADKQKAQLDFASLLFQAPAPRTTVGSSAPGADDDSGDDADDGSPAPRRRGSSRSAGSSGDDQDDRSRRGASSPDRDDDSSEADSADGAEGQDGTEDSDDSDDSDGRERSSGSSRRRRRRGGRGRRGRGRSEDDSDGDSAAEGEDSSGGSEGEDRSEDSGAEDSGPDTSGGSSSSGSSSSRRRRRRRRSGSSGGDESSPDDPPNTVVKVREARDEVQSVKGSTRLEAKKQRRREGRDQGRRRNVITEAEFLARRESVKRSMIVRERPGRTQIAVLEDDVLVEHYVAQKSQTSMVGNVYLGKVQNVLPSMEAAFVDIGRGRNAVLYAGEVNWDAAGMEGQPRRIELALKSGDPVLVQVTKDPIGHKGARLTSQISLPGRYVVFVPGGSMTGISRKLPDTERNRLKRIMRDLIPEDAGVIVRTAAEGASEEELTRDVERLRSQWEKIQKSQKSKSAPATLSQEPDIAIKVVRDIFNEDFKNLIIEGDSVYQELHEYVSAVAPDLLDRVTKHVGEKDAFAKHRVDEQLLKAMDRKVYLPSGGSLVIDRTEAMVVVDVNTGKFTGSGGSLEETVTKNNLEAAEEIVRQLRLRDIGGIIVIDFIDMVLEANRDLVLRRLVECLGRDRTKHQVAEVTSLGLVQMTRKRVGQGLVDTFSTTCEHCNGRGILVDIDGDHSHTDSSDHDGSGRGNGGGSGSNGGSRRRGRKGRGGSRSGSDSEHHGSDEGSATGSGGSTAGDVHRIESDEQSRALARATIASIAAASSKESAPEVTVDGQVVAVDSPQDAAPAQQAPAAGAEVPSAAPTPETQSGPKAQPAPEAEPAGESSGEAAEPGAEAESGDPAGQ